MSSSSGGLSDGLEVDSLGGGDLRGVLNLEGHLSNVNWSNEWGVNWSNWEIGGSNPESVDWVGNIVHLLDNSVSIYVTVCAAGDSIKGLDFALGTWATSISIAVLAELVLGVVLAGGNLGSHDGVSESKNGGSEVGVNDGSSASAGQDGGENDEGFHFDW